MMTGAPAKGFLLLQLPVMGELTEVASVKRAVLGVLMVKDEAELDFRSLVVMSGLFFSSAKGDL